jgi:DnaJ-class molecular chaperone
MESLAVEILLDPEKAVFGGIVPLGIPVYQYCPVCGGTRPKSFFRCEHCDGDGIVEELKTVTINEPARLAPRTNLDLSLENLGIHNLFLRVHISASKQV